MSTDMGNIKVFYMHVENEKRQAALSDSLIIEIWIIIVSTCKHTMKNKNYRIIKKPIYFAILTS